MTILAGDEPTAQEIEDLRILAVVKAADESRNTTTTLANDSELVLAVEASVTYMFESVIFQNSAATPDYKGQWSVPAGTTGRFQCTGYSLAGTLGIFDNATITTTQTIAGAGAAQPHLMTGYITTSTTPGNLRWTWAQNTSNGSNSTTLAGSYIKMWKVS